MKMNSTILALLLFVGAILLYSVAVSPLSASLSRTQGALSTDVARLNAMELDIRTQDDLTVRVKELEATNKLHRASWIAPMLNSYAMRVKSLVDAMAFECGLTGVEYTEGTLRALPVPSAQVPTRRTARRSVHMKAFADYAAIASFILRAERDLPLMTVQAFTIVPRQDNDKERQSVDLILEWPCEGEVVE